MGKFFLPDSQKTKHKKPTDYKIIIYKDVLEVIKTKHLNFISAVIKDIKELQKQGKDIKQKQQHLKELKTIKKRQMKVLAIYLITNKLALIPNLSALEKTLIDIDIKDSQVTEDVENSEVMKKFLEKVMSSALFKSTLQKIGQLKQTVTRKKMQTKQKNKQRKQRKLEIRRNKGLLNGDNKKQISQFKQNLDSSHNNHQLSGDLSDEQERSNSQFFVKGSDSGDGISQEMTRKINQQKKQPIPKLPPKTKKIQKEEKVEKKPLINLQPKSDFWKRNNERLAQSQNSQNNYQNKREDNEKKERTQFKKTGRNKVLAQKKQKFQKPAPPRAVAPPKPQQHPSWAAKKQLKEQAVIGQFQGKRIVL